MQGFGQVKQKSAWKQARDTGLTQINEYKTFDNMDVVQGYQMAIRRTESVLCWM